MNPDYSGFFLIYDATIWMILHLRVKHVFLIGKNENENEKNIIYFDSIRYVLL